MLGQAPDLDLKRLQLLVEAAPSTWSYIETINNRILTGDMYKALKESRRLIAYEQELLDNATRRAGLRKRGKTDVDAA